MVAVGSKNYDRVRSQQSNITGAAGRAVSEIQVSWPRRPAVFRRYAFRTFPRSQAKASFSTRLPILPPGGREEQETSVTDD